MNFIEAIWGQNQYFKCMASILLNYKMNAISKTFYFLKFNLFMQNISIPWMIRFSSHIMKDRLFKRGITVSKQSKSLVENNSKCKHIGSVIFSPDNITIISETVWYHLWIKHIILLKITTKNGRSFCRLHVCFLEQQEISGKRHFFANQMSHVWNLYNRVME